MCINTNHVYILYFLQLKNMVAQLFQSRPSGARSFEVKGVSFGWKVIEKMYARELQRMKANTLVRVPGLKESHIIRDAWTRLNVKPAKIMQVQFAISDLQSAAIVSDPVHTCEAPMFVCFSKNTSLQS